MKRLLIAWTMSAFVCALLPTCVTAAEPVIGSSNQAPVARVTDDFVGGVLPLEVCVDASKSYDPEGKPLTYRWDFGDGRGTAALPKACHVYVEEGLYAASVTVTDEHGLTDMKTVVVSVQARTTPGA